MEDATELPELDSAPELIEANRQVATANSVYLSAASAWHAALRHAADVNGNGGAEAAQQAVAVAQSAYLEARDRLERARAEREEVRNRLHQERNRELKAQALTEALERQDRMRELHHQKPRGFVGRLFGRR
jgi:molecular chaperone GrpE (heat shock protein)